MSTKQIIKLTDTRAIEVFWQAVGVNRAAAAIEDNACSLPGYALAKALVQVEQAKMQASMAAQTHREAARAGLLLSDALSAVTTLVDDVPAIEIEFADQGAEDAA